MCEPATLALIATTVGPAMTAAVSSGAASAALTGVGIAADISAQNKAAKGNARNAKIAMNQEQATTTEQYIEQNRSLLQGGFDAILEGRAAESEAYTSAIQNGVQGASVKAVLRDRKQKTARGAGRTNQEMDSLKRQTGANLDHIRSKAQGRINQSPTTSIGFGDLARIAAPMVNAQMD